VESVTVGTPAPAPAEAVAAAESITADAAKAGVD